MVGEVGSDSVIAHKRVAILGAGSWGTAIAHHLVGGNCSVCLWGNEPEVVDEVNVHHKNSRYFPQDLLDSRIVATGDIAASLRDATLVVVAVPSFAVREVVRRARPHLLSNAHIVCVAKGLEDETHQFLSDAIGEESGHPELVSVLSGPSFAVEVLRGQPTAVTVAAKDIAVATVVGRTFHYGTFRVYTNTDIYGVQVGGAVKNVIAVAVGMADGVGIGFNARAALVTRGLAEIKRLAVAAGGDAMTVTGLSGLGDLLLTATGDLSRNRQVGVRLGRGESLSEILKSIGQVAEGVETAPKVLEMAKKYGVELPITAEVVRVLRGESTVQQSVQTLLSRSMRSEQIVI